MAENSAASLKGREISISTRDKPDFAAMRAATSGLLVGGLLGAAINISAGNEIVAQNDVDDPAGQIGRTLGGALEAAHGARVSRLSGALSSDDAAEVRKMMPAADLVLDIRTINWSFLYFPLNWTKYRVLYSARGRLIDAKNGEVLAESGCVKPLDEEDTERMLLRSAAQPSGDDVHD